MFCIKPFYFDKDLHTFLHIFNINFVGSFYSGGLLYPKVSSRKVPSSRRVLKSLNRLLIKRPSLYKSESMLHQRGPLGRTVPKH